MGVLVVRTYSRPFLLSLLCLSFAAPAGAATVPGHPWCGTQPPGPGLAVELAAHRDHQRRLGRQRAEEKALRTFPEAIKVGDIGVLVDDGSIIVQPNQLDLDELGVQYVPQKKGGYVVSPSADGVSGAIGDKIPMGDDDARQITLPKGFKFRFYNKVYTKLFVHSDGNLTFNAPDAESTERSLFRHLGGPPRIAPLFADLNPATASGEGGVYVLTDKAKIVVTWLDVPSFGTNDRNTFQAVLYATGRITFAFGRLDSRVGIVGLAPGGGGQVQLLDYTASLPTGAIKTAVAERFATERAIDNLAIAQAFFREFADDYDHLVVFLDFPQSFGSAFAFEITLKNDIKGIGVNVFDASAAVGSKGRLRSFVQMGTLSRYPDDPETVFLGTNDTLALLGQETGHRWLSFLHFLDGNGERSNALLGRDLAHWSFCHNSLASDMEGNEINDEGGGRFMTVAATQRFSPLDQYAMGLIPAAEVPPFYFVENCGANPSGAPETGRILQGNRVDLTIDQIIAAEGQRVPPANKAPHTFNQAFVLVAPGEGPSAEGLAKVDRIRAAWEPYFAQATDGNGAVDTTLKTRRRR